MPMLSVRSISASTLAAVTAGSLALAPAALAARNSLGVHTVVDAKGANVRETSKKTGGATNVYRGHLKKGERFTVTKHQGSFCFGKAAGKVQRDGWVLCGALSTTVR